MVASTIGGYISGRFRSKWTGIHSYEVQFRDTAHGFLAWALATIVGAAALAGAATFLAGGATAGATATTSSRSDESAASNYYVALLMRPTSGQPNASASNGSVTGNFAGSTPASQARAILGHDLPTGGQTSSADRAYLAQLVSAQTGANQADAEKRVDEVLNQAKTDADQARKVAASISIWLTIAMFVGAFSASLAAIEGGQLRDRRWRGVIGSRAYSEGRIET